MHRNFICFLTEKENVLAKAFMIVIPLKSLTSLIYPLPALWKLIPYAHRQDKYHYHTYISIIVIVLELKHFLQSMSNSTIRSFRFKLCIFLLIAYIDIYLSCTLCSLFRLFVICSGFCNKSSVSFHVVFFIYFKQLSNVNVP